MGELSTHPLWFRVRVRALTRQNSLETPRMELADGASSPPCGSSFSPGASIVSPCSLFSGHEMKCKMRCAQSGPALCDPMVCSLPWDFPTLAYPALAADPLPLRHLGFPFQNTSSPQGRPALTPGHPSVEKLRPREGKGHAQGHALSPCWSKGREVTPESFSQKSLASK